jgi:prepilin-type N-terminal cleavage/methylation domain-containing protein/prepilin-type processing-associated H-X9-DG protein
MKHRGFTLPEMLIVLAVIATLAGIGIPVGRSVIGKSRQAACLGQLRSLGTALEGYLQEHNQTMPDLVMMRASKTDDAKVLETVLLPYVDGPQAFRCPQDRKEFDKSGSSYLWNPTQSELPVSRLEFFGIESRPDKIPLIVDKAPWHPGGVNYLYADQSSSNKPRFATSN